MLNTHLEHHQKMLKAQINFHDGHYDTYTVGKKIFLFVRPQL